VREIYIRRRIVRSVVLLAFLGLAGATGWHFLGPVPVEVVHPERGPAVNAVYGAGTVEPVVMLPIGPKIMGRLQQLHVDEGSFVRRGQALAELDNRELSAAVAEWESRVRYGEAQFRRATELYKSRIGTEAAFDQARNELETAKALLERARRQLAEMTLAAPADGVIIRRDGEIGQVINPTDTVFWMSCCEKLRIAAEIDEEDIRFVKPGQKVLIRTDAFGDRVFEGSVAEITPKGDPVTRSFRVRISLPPEMPLMIGMTADCNIVTDERKDALLVPNSAVADGKVWLVQNGSAVQRAVTAGVNGQLKTEIKTGVAEDDLVVVRPERGLRDGRRVRILPKDESSP
jgi:RND family efflux transporter MFP subunit